MAAWTSALARSWTGTGHGSSPWTSRYSVARTSWSSPTDAFTVAVAGRLAGIGVPVHGPSWHGYVTERTFTGGSHRDVERISGSDDRLRRLRKSVDPAEWSEAGFPLNPAAADVTPAFYGLADGEDLMAAGNMTDWAGLPADVGLLTRPECRGRGHATAVAASMAGDMLPEVEVVRYRALFTNTPSLAVAAKLGFEHYGANIIAGALSGH